MRGDLALRHHGEVSLVEVVPGAQHGSVPVRRQRVREAVAEVQRRAVAAPAEPAPTVQRSIDLSSIDGNDVDLAVAEDPFHSEGSCGAEPRLHHDPELDQRGRRDRPLVRKVEGFDGVAGTRLVAEDCDDGGSLGPIDAR